MLVAEISVAIIVIIVIVGYFFARMIIYPKTKTWEETFKIEEKNQDLKKSDYELYKSSPTIFIKSDYGYKLGAKYYPVEKSKGIIIIMHGITYSSVGSFKFIKPFQKLGYSVFVFDHRNHGISEGRITSLGHYEKRDVTKIIKYIKDEYNPKMVGLHGTSMGAAIALETIKIEKDLDFVIADCPFSDLMMQLRDRLKADYHLPAFPLLPLARIWVKGLASFDIKDVSPIRELELVDKPILFIHGDADGYIKKEMSIKMYNKKKDLFSLYLTKNADHAMAFTQDREKYMVEVHDFLVKNNKY